MQFAETSTVIVTSVYHNTVIEVGCYGIIQFRLQTKKWKFSVFGISKVPGCCHIFCKVKVLYMYITIQNI